jgi:hypothetical protein
VDTLHRRDNDDDDDDDKNNNNVIKLEDEGKRRIALFGEYVPPRITNAYTPKLEGYRKPTEYSDVIF